MGIVKPLVIGDLVAKVPLIQGGMGVGVSLSSLAGAVAAEGGIGVISTAQIGYREPDFDADPIGANLRAIGTEIRKAREIAKGGILGVNIMVATRKYEEYVKAAVEAGIDLIISGDETGSYRVQRKVSAGDPALLVEKVYEAAGCGDHRRTAGRRASWFSQGTA